MTIRTLMASMVAVAFVAAAALAQESACQTKTANKGCCTATGAVAKDSKGECKLECTPEEMAECATNGCESFAKAAGVPMMTYVVGEESTACPESAKELAKGDATKIKYAVAGKSYDTEGEAKRVYAQALEDFLNKELMTVKYSVGDQCIGCPMTAQEVAKKEGKKLQYRVAAFTFDSQEKADAAIKQAREAVEKVHLTMKVGDKQYQCDQEAAKVAKEQGKQVEFCIGENSTCCKVTADADLARAKVNAAIVAIVKASHPTQG